MADHKPSTSKGNSKSDGKSIRGMMSSGGTFSSSAQLTVGTAALLVSTFSNAALPTCVTAFLNAKKSGNDSVPLVGGARLLFGEGNKATLRLLATVVAIGGVASGVRSRLVKGAEEKLEANLREVVYEAVVSGDLETVEEGILDGSIAADKDKDADSHVTHVASLLSLLTDKTSIAAKAFTTTTSSMIRSVFSIFNGGAILWSISPRLSCCSLLVLPTIGTAYHIVSKIKKKYTKQLENEKLKAVSEAEETFRLLQSVKIFNTESFHLDKFKKRTSRILSLGGMIGNLEGLYMSTVFGLTGVTLGGLAYLGAEEIKSNRLPGGTGDVSRFIIHTSLLATGAIGVMKSMGEYKRGKVAAEEIFDLMGKIESSRLNEKADVTYSGQRLELKHVNFKYASRSALALEDVSLVVKSGEVVALVGQNGSGKSTIVNLFGGAYRPQNPDTVFLPAVSTASPPSSTVSTVGVVSQQKQLFSGTIAENIMYGQPSTTLISDPAVQKAISITNLESFVNDLPGKFDTLVGMDGLRLSGGQRARIAIARGLVGNPKALLLDEVTSELDGEGSKSVWEVVRRFRNDGGCVLVVTHDLADVIDSSKVDKIVVMKDGRVAETGKARILTEKRGGELQRLLAASELL